MSDRPIAGEPTEARPTEPTTGTPAARPGRPRWVRIERRLDASPERVYRAWADPAEMTRWFPLRIEGSLAPGTRSELVWSRRRTWIDVLAAEPNQRFVFRWPWLADESYQTKATITILPAGNGSRVVIEDGPFDIDRPGVLEAFEEALAGWGETIAHLRAQLDFSVDLRTEDH